MSVLSPISSGIPEALLLPVRRALGGQAAEGLSLLSGGASDRWYARLDACVAEFLFGRPSAIVMGVPPRLWRTVEAFADISRHLVANGIPAPEVLRQCPREGISVITDLGDLTLTRAVADDPARRMELAARAVGLLAAIHMTPTAPPERCAAVRLHFDYGKYAYEFSFHVGRWLMKHLDATPTPRQRQTLAAAFDWICRRLAAEPRVFTHRDYQSSNLLAQADGSLAVIDFQDARLGLRQYDLASFLYDSYIPYSGDERDALVQVYVEAAENAGWRSDKSFDELLTVAAIQRKLHDVGAFIYTAHARGKTDYLAYVPGTMDMIADLMGRIPETREAGAVLRRFADSAGEHA